MREYMDKFEFTFRRSTFVAYVCHDLDHGTPWDAEEGHGEVSAWTARDKRPGELILSSERHGRKRFYDFAGACRTALRDKWGLPLAELQKRGWVGPNKATPRQRASVAAMLDYANLKAWCDDEWCYVGVVVYRLDRHGNEMRHEMECLWGVESTSEDYIRNQARELAMEANHKRLAATRERVLRRA